MGKTSQTSLSLLFFSAGTFTFIRVNRLVTTEHCVSDLMQLNTDRLTECSITDEPKHLLSQYFTSGNETCRALYEPGWQRTSDISAFVTTDSFPQYTGMAFGRESKAFRSISKTSAKSQTHLMTVMFVH